MANILIGIILKPQGIKGDVKIKAYSDDLDHFLIYKKFYIDGQIFEVERNRHDGNFVFIKFKNINTMNDAELLRSKELYIDDSELRVLEKDEYYISELIDSKIIINGNESGRILDVITDTSNTILEIEINGKKASMPLVKKVIVSFDGKNKKIVFDEIKLKEVILFED